MDENNYCGAETTEEKLEAIREFISYRKGPDSDVIRKDLESIDINNAEQISRIYSRIDLFA